MKLVRRLTILAAGPGAARKNLLLSDLGRCCHYWVYLRSRRLCKNGPLLPRGFDAGYEINGGKQWQIGQADHVYNFRAKSAYQATAKGTLPSSNI
jgi:hypothetical protein